MSYDLLVATLKRPSRDLIEAFGATAGLDLALDGRFGKGNVLVTRQGDGVRTIDLDGPSAVEPDDLPDDLAGTVRRPACLVEFHLSGGRDPRTDAWAIDLAISIARSGDGAVYDPQAERILWPTGVVPSAVLLAALRGVWPEAVPVRFGTDEPFQGRLERDEGRRSGLPTVTARSVIP